MATSYTKMKDGSWGIRVAGERPVEGTAVVVSKRDGSEKAETVGKVVWSGDGVHLCTIATPATTRCGTFTTPRPSRRPWRPCGYPGCNPRHCDECEGFGYQGGGR